MSDDQDQNPPPEKSGGDATEGSASREVPDKPPAPHPHLIAADGEGDPDEGAKEYFDADGKESEEPKPGEETAKGLVVFDFDGTLIEEDSLQMLIVDTVGDSFRAYCLLIWAFFTSLWEGIVTRRDFMDMRSGLKTHWMMHTLAGRTVEEIEQTAEKMRTKINWRDKLVHDLKACAEKNYDVVVATGALNVYMPILLCDLPVTAMICTHAEVVDGKLTGRLTGPKEHCNIVRREKRLRVQEYISQRGPFAPIIGYGNLPHDGPMLALCDEFFII